MFMAVVIRQSRENPNLFMDQIAYILTFFLGFTQLPSGYD